METLSVFIHAYVNTYCPMISTLSKENTLGYQWNVLP